MLLNLHLLVWNRSKLAHAWVQKLQITTRLPFIIIIIALEVLGRDAGELIVVIQMPCFFDWIPLHIQGLQLFCTTDLQSVWSLRTSYFVIRFSAYNYSKLAKYEYSTAVSCITSTLVSGHGFPLPAFPFVGRVWCWSWSTASCSITGCSDYSYKKIYQDNSCWKCKNNTHRPLNIRTWQRIFCSRRKSKRRAKFSFRGSGIFMPLLPL